MQLFDREQVDGAARLWGLQGFRVEDVELKKEVLSEGGARWMKVVRVIDQRKWHLCPCGRRDHEVLFAEDEESWYRDCSLGDFETYVVALPMRLRCGGGSRVEQFPWAADGHRMTRRFFERLAALCHQMPVSAAAKMCGVSWDTAARVDAAAIRLALGGDVPGLGRLRWLGIDEVSRTGGHVYFTVVTDLETGRVVHLGDGKREEALAGFFEKLGPRGCRKIRGVVSDLAASFLNVIERYVPKARHAIDRFHIVQWTNEALNEIRRRIFGGAPKDALGKDLKVKKWILLSAQENLEPEHQQGCGSHPDQDDVSSRDSKYLGPVGAGRTLAPSHASQRAGAWALLRIGSTPRSDAREQAGGGGDPAIGSRPDAPGPLPR